MPLDGTSLSHGAPQNGQDIAFGHSFSNVHPVTIVIAHKELGFSCHSQELLGSLYRTVRTLLSLESHFCSDILTRADDNDALFGWRVFH
jgi:hypothetical protein